MVVEGGNKDDPWPLADHRLLWICGDAAHLVRRHLVRRPSCHGCPGGWTARRERCRDRWATTAAGANLASVQSVASCGVERWSVKTLQDRPRLLPVKTVTLAYLVSRPAPSNLPYTRLPFERHVFRVTAAVTLIRSESDNDFHLVLSDGRRTMIAETPLGVMRRPRNLCGAETDEPSAGCSTSLRKGNDHRRRLLRLLPRPNRRCPKRDRTAPSPRLRLPIEAGASAFSPSRDSTLTPAPGCLPNRRPLHSHHRLRPQATAPRPTQTSASHHRRPTSTAETSPTETSVSSTTSLTPTRTTSTATTTASAARVRCSVGSGSGPPFSTNTRCRHPTQ